MNATTHTAVLLTALDVETRAVLRHLPGWADVTVKGTVFYQGHFDGWNVVIAEVGAGNQRAASITERAIQHFDPAVAIFVGVAGGIKDVLLGDVVIATKVYGYESGKDTQFGFNPRPEVQSSAHALEQRGRALSKRNDWQRRLDAGTDQSAAKVLIGPIAAGEKVIASKKSATAKFLKANYGDALAVEMEGRGFLEGAHINAPVQACVIRGISDLLTGKRTADKAGWQERAAANASAVVFEMLAGLTHSRSNQPSAHGRSNQPSKPPFPETPSTISKAAFYKRNEVLAQVGVPNEDEVQFRFSDSADAYLRIIPGKSREAPIMTASLNAAAPHAPLLGRLRYGAPLTSVNRYGVLAYEPTSVSRGGFAEMNCGTQLFPNGELWCVSKIVIIRERSGRPAWVPIPLLPATIFEKQFYRAFHEAVRFAVDYLALTTPFTVEFGLINLQGVSLAVKDDDIRRISVDEVVVRNVLTKAAEIDLNEALLSFFEKVYDVTGYPRPPRLHNFPPGPPT